MDSRTSSASSDDTTQARQLIEHMDLRSLKAIQRFLIITEDHPQLKDQLIQEILNRIAKLEIQEWHHPT